MNNTKKRNSVKLSLSRNYRNEYLFSEIYLQDIIQRPVTDENLRASLQTIKEWREYADKTSLEKWTTTYIEPALDTLGFGHHREKEGISNVLLLFPDVDKTKPMSICYVVPPGEDINCTIKGKHWAEKIIRNLRKHNFEWGILTGGIYWRIYHTKESTPYETYVEVNLESILNNQDYPAFQIFYFFFQPDNFIKKENGECKFDDYKEESVKTTEYIEENLRTAIERKEEGGQGVLQTLCLGYLDVLRKETYCEEERKRIYGGAILYLFRLLFLFYSTARALLKSERIEVFKSIVLDSFRFHNEGGAQSNSYNLWLRLQDLFAEIDMRYNGGLFNPHESNLTQFIEEIRITDPFLSEVVFGLAYYRNSKRNFVPIEYRDLSVRHLGSLYEGLLEHNLFIAPENTVVRKSGTKVRFIPQSQAGRITRSETIIEKGKVYFSEDAKERKLTGSYYTPEDVVEYIVKNTVDVLLGEKKQELVADIEPVLKELDSAINESERERLELFIDDKILKFIEGKILSLSVLDPTMGSGHFLVNATNHIANFIVEILNEYPGDDSNVDSNPALLRRRVVEDCIYGVDLNPLAVELAKLCLWITTAFKEKPLSFLNHHLKQGNTLVGVRISDLEKHLEKTRGKYDLFMQSYINSVRQASEGYKEKLSKLTEAREDIEEKKEALVELDEDLFPYKHLCNLFTHCLLGELKKSDLLSQIANWKKPNLPAQAGEAEKLPASLNSKDFFHWDLEFPDVFYNDNPGFDCVIGNPPYVEYSKVREQYKIIGYETQKCGNLYAFICERSLHFLKDGGRFGMIVPISLPSTHRMNNLRVYIENKSKDIYCSNFADRPGSLFIRVHQKSSILLLNKSTCSYGANLYVTPYYHWYSNERGKLFQNIKYLLLENIPQFNFWLKIGNDIELNIINKIYLNKRSVSYYLSDVNGSHKIYLNMRMMYWPKCFKKKMKSKEYKEFCLVSENLSYVLLAIFNSTLFFYCWEIISDGWHITKKELEFFKFDYEFLPQEVRDNLISYAKALEGDLEKNKVFVGTKQTDFEYYHKKSKSIIDKIDIELANHYGFTKEELNFILHYQKKFRIG